MLVLNMVSEINATTIIAKMKGNSNIFQVPTIHMNTRNKEIWKGENGCCPRVWTAVYSCA